MGTKGESWYDVPIAELVGEVIIAQSQIHFQVAVNEDKSRYKFRWLATEYEQVAQELMILARSISLMTERDLSDYRERTNVTTY